MSVSRGQRVAHEMKELRVAFDAVGKAGRRAEDRRELRVMTYIASGSFPLLIEVSARLRRGNKERERARSPQLSLEVSDLLLQGGNLGVLSRCHTQLQLDSGR